MAGNGSNLFDWIYNGVWEKITEEQHSNFVNMFLAGAKSRMSSTNKSYGDLEKTDIKIIKSPCPKKEVALGLCCIGRVGSGKIEQLGSTFKESDITGWVRVFLKSFETNFSENGYSQHLFGNNELVQRIQSDKGWVNLAKRQLGNKKKACAIMMTDILGQLYRQSEKK